MIYIIGWCIIAELCVLIAEENNRNGIIAAVCGLLFGIFALIYYIAVGKNEDKNDK